MTLAELRSFIRDRLDDMSQPYAWSDAFIDAAINRAEREASERALLIYDDTQTIAVTQGNPDYSIPLSTIVIDRLWLPDHALIKTTRLDLDNKFSRWESRVETPSHYIQDGYNIKLVGIPDADYTLGMAIYRRPVNLLQNDTDVSEIPAEFHEFLVHYVLYEAYSKRDEDIYDPNAAQNNLAEFTAIFGRKKSAKHMSMVKRHAANSRVYGRRFK